jgi:hypothetical protein
MIPTLDLREGAMLPAYRSRTLAIIITPQNEWVDEK